MAPLPQDNHLEGTVALFSDPYQFIPKTCAKLGSDAFEARILLEKTICLTGAEAAALVYDTTKFQRAGAAPRLLQVTLFGKGGVQGLDDEEHRHRKAMFLSLMTPESIERIGTLVEQQWRLAIDQHPPGRDFVLYDELHTILTRAACQWTGVAVPEGEFPEFVREVTALFDKAGDVGPGHLWSRVARHRADRRMERVIEEIRAGTRTVAEDAPAHVVAWHRDLHGQLLDPKTAAVELLNLLRPIVAVSVYMTFAALAIYDYLGVRERLAANEAGYDERFAQEVRRFYPFFPAIAAKVRQDFQWRGYDFKAGRRILLDLYGTNHDPRTWSEPDRFHPDRFLTGEPGPFNFIPQGGGDHAAGHRCPGEWFTIELIRKTGQFLTQHVDYEVPPQDLSIKMTRLPALPRSRFVMRNVRLRPEPVATAVEFAAENQHPVQPAEDAPTSGLR